MSRARIALIGDYRASVTAHTAIQPALHLAARELGVDVEAVWIHTSKLTSKVELQSLCGYQGIWCVPASPYANTEGAICAISIARTEGIPFLGTCAGFQHFLMEYFRNVIGAVDVAHAELKPESEHPLISKLSCSLVDVIGPIRLTPGSLSHRLYATERVEEAYRCSYGLNPEFAHMLRNRSDLSIEGVDDAGEVRIIRLQGHPFFVATLFQPERSSLKGVVHPLIREFVSVASGSQANPKRPASRQGFKGPSNMNRTKQHRYEIGVEWTGNCGEGTETYKSYRRDHRIFCSGKSDIQGSSDPSFRGDSSRYNPEELFVASLSTCHMLWYLHLCSANHINVLDYRDSASGLMQEHEDGSGEFVEVILRPVVKVRVGHDRTKAVTLHDEAHHCCFIARSVKFPVRVVSRVEEEIERRLAIEGG